MVRSLSAALVLTLFASAASAEVIGFTDEQKLRVDLRNLEIATNYFDHLNKDEQREVVQSLLRVRETWLGLVPLFKSDRADYTENQDAPPVILIVPGYHDKAGSDWYEPFGELYRAKADSYFHKWPLWNTFGKNVRNVMNSIRTIRKLHPKRKIMVLGYCSGGTISLRAFQNLKSLGQAEGINLMTLASPLQGYNAPPYAFIAAPFAGATTVKIGRGVFRKWHDKAPIPGCSHWVTTDCDLDVHACLVGGHYPQVIESGMPCGDQNTYRFSGLTHTTVVAEAVKYVLGLRGLSHDR